jgi:DNA mismatch repair ATPase MutS
MKAFLMHPDRDFDVESSPLPNEASLVQDLELKALWRAMAAGDEFIFKVVSRALLMSLRDPDDILYRQQILTDCLENPSAVRELYELAGEALKAEKSVWGSFHRDSPKHLLSTSVQKMELLVDFLKKLREVAETRAGEFQSPGFRRLFSMLREELRDDYLAQVERHLSELSFKGGMLFSAQLGAGNKGKNHVLRRPRAQGFFGRMLDRSGYSFTIADRDNSGFKALDELENRATNLAANALAQSLEHVVSFFTMLRTELGFWVGCINLHERLAAQEEPTCVPVPLPAGELVLSGRGIYDVSLAVSLRRPVIGNDIEADGKSLVIITGANQGGKSTFLRGLAVAQLMMQSGMFVAADSFRASACAGIFTHYKREEDEAMESGKLDEELARMSEIADQIRPGAILLCNESFASTNEREGSEIARQVVNAFLEESVKVLFVTHMFDFADGFYRQSLDTALFLRAERGSDGARPFKLSESRPLPTSYGEDSYEKVFGTTIERGVTDVTRS